MTYRETMTIIRKQAKTCIIKADQLRAIEELTPRERKRIFNKYYQ